MKRIIAVFLCMLMCAGLFAGCAGEPEHKSHRKKQNTEEPNTEEPNTEEPNTEEPNTEEPNTEEPNTEEPNMEKVYATIEFEGFGTVKLELYPEIAPQSVCNFVSLARKGFYDGLTIHRIVPGFVIQGGDPLGNGTGGPGYCIKGEFAENGFKKNNLKHDRGVISWARTPAPDSAGCQFFIVLSDDPNNHYALDGKYAGFGKVIKGMEVIDAIAAVETDALSCPLMPVIIKSVTVTGPELPEPEKLPGK